MGVIFSLLSAIVLNAGNLTQKHAFSSMPQVSDAAPTSSGPWCDPGYGCSGFVLCLVGLAFQILAFAHAPIPVVQSIFNAGIVLLIIVSRLKLGERLHSIEWAGIGIVLVSLTLIAVSLGGAEGSIGLVNAWWRVLSAAIPTLLVVIVIVMIIRSQSALRRIPVRPGGGPALWRGRSGHEGRVDARGARRASGTPSPASSRPSTRTCSSYSPSSAC